MTKVELQVKLEALQKLLEEKANEQTTYHYYYYYYYLFFTFFAKVFTPTLRSNV